MVSILVPKLADLGFVRETLILKNWNISNLIGYKDISLQFELSSVLLFWKKWREAPGTWSPSLPIYSAAMLDTIYDVSLKVLLLCVWTFTLRYPHLSYFQHRSFEQNWFHQLGLMRVFPRWRISGLFIIANLYRLPCVTFSSSRYENFTTVSTFHSLYRTDFKI